MTWLNDIIAAKPIPCTVAGEDFAFFPVCPGIWIDEPTARLTPTQQAILDHLKARAPRAVSGFELRDAVAPNTDDSNMRVQIHRMRKAGVEIESRPGVRGGYRVEEPA